MKELSKKKGGALSIIADFIALTILASSALFVVGDSVYLFSRFASSVIHDIWHRTYLLPDEVDTDRSTQTLTVVFYSSDNDSPSTVRHRRRAPSRQVSRRR